MVEMDGGKVKVNERETFTFFSFLPCFVVTTFPKPAAKAVLSDRYRTIRISGTFLLLLKRMTNKDAASHEKCYSHEARHQGPKISTKYL